MPVLLSSNLALIGGNPTKPGSGYYALIKAVLSLRDRDHEYRNLSIAALSRCIYIYMTISTYMHREEQSSRHMH